MSAPVGLTTTATVTLDNTTEKDLVLPWSSSLPLVFFPAEPGPITIPALASYELQVVYAPCSLQEVQGATIVVGSKQKGCEWTLLVSGSGRAPEPMPLTQVSSAVGSFSNNRSLSALRLFFHDYLTLSSQSCVCEPLRRSHQHSAFP